MLHSFGRSPLGLRGLKLYPFALMVLTWYCRSPLGLRGLKYSSAERADFRKVVAALLGCVD